MANEISLFKSGAAVPDYLREGADEMTKRLAGGSTGRSISIKGGVWRMVVGGEEVSKNEDRAMNFVVVNAAPSLSRVYYAGAYVEGENAAPGCFSSDTKTPDPSVKAPQSRLCATCPQNIEGSGPNKTRACRFNQRIAVVLEGDLEGNVYRLQLPGKSFFGKPEGDKMGFQAYARFLAGHNVPMSSVVTEARFDTDEAVPVLLFRAARPLSRDEIAIARSQGASEDAKAAIDTKYVLKDSTSNKALPAPTDSAEPAEFVEPEGTSEPTVKTGAKKAIPAAAPQKLAETLSNWTDDDDED